MKFEVKIEDNEIEIVNVDTIDEGCGIVVDDETREINAVEFKDGQWEFVEWDKMEINKEYVWMGIDDSIYELEDMTEDEIKESGYIKRLS